MQKLDYLESKINEILTEISYLAERCDLLEAKINDTKSSQSSKNNN